MAVSVHCLFLVVPGVGLQCLIVALPYLCKELAVQMYVSMIRKYHNHTLQANPRYHEESLENMKNFKFEWPVVLNNHILNQRMLLY